MADEPSQGRPNRNFGPGRTLRAEKRLGELRIPARGHPKITFPPAERAGIDPEAPSRRHLGEAPFPPEGEQELANGRAVHGA